MTTALAALIGKEVTFYYDDIVLHGKLTNHQPDLFFVCESVDEHFVFRSHEVQVAGNIITLIH